MEYPLKRECIADGVHFSSIRDKKFKHNRMSVNLIVPLDREKVTNNAVVPYILRQGYEDCPDFTELNKKLSDLYGASLDAYVDSFGEYQIIGLGTVGLDSRFALNGEDMVDCCADLLANVVLKPNMPGGVFTEQDTELEKLYLIDTIDSEINEKRVYAMLRCKGIMCEGEPAAIKKYGYREDAQRITPESAAAAYRDILKCARIEILFEGSGDPEPAKKLFAQRFQQQFAKPGWDRAPITVNPYCTRNQQGEVKTVTDQMDVRQGKLVMGFRVEGCETYRQMNAERVAIALLGGTAMSLLFKTVREKYSLCYYCSSRYDRTTGIMMVDSGVEAENAERAKEEILNQIQAMKRGDFEQQEILETQMVLKTALKATTDSLSAMESWYLTQILGGTEISPNQEIELCEQVTKADIIDAINRVKLDTVYTLLPELEQ